jgi:hypothetical protein
MSKMIEAWKEIPDMEEEESSSCTAPASLSQRRSSLAGDAAFLWNMFFRGFGFYLFRSDKFTALVLYKKSHTMKRKIKLFFV